MCIDDIIIFECTAEERVEGMFCGEIVKRDGTNIQEVVFVFFDIYLTDIQSKIVFDRQG